MESKTARKNAGEGALCFPLKDQLDESRGILSLEKSWVAIEGRLSRAERGVFFGVLQWLGDWSRSEQRRSIVFGAGFALVLLLALMGSGRLRGFLDEGASSAGLAVVGGASEIRLRVEPGQAQKVVRFEDDSAVELKAGSLESIESNSSRLTLRLSHGRARFSVTPGGQRTWTVKTEFADVEVVGTVFQVAVEGAALEVLVERGVVVVRSSLIEGGRRQLTAGESLRVSGKPAEDSAPSAEREERRLERAKDEGALSLEQLEEELEDPTVLASSKQEQGGSAAELMGQADVARASGRYAEAERILARLIASFPGDARAASAAFTRGVIQQQALQQPDAAIASFRQVLRLGASTSLREDAYRRWFEVLVGLGRAAEARSVRQQYAQAFPNGQYLPNMGKDSAKGVTTEAGSAP